MPPLPRRRKNAYFSPEPDAPPPLVVRLTRRVAFSDVDAMAVMWHGRYAHLFEQANEELGLLCGLGYADFQRHRLRAPVVQLHVDYFAPLTLGESAAVTGKMIWNQGARINIEYQVHRQNGDLAAAGYTVQMFTDETGLPLLAPPALQETCLNRWRAGEFGGPR